MPKHPLPLFGRALVLLAASVVPLAAQETGFTSDLKLRVGYGLETKDHLRASSLGFGLNLGYTTGLGTFGAELGYYYKGGDRYIEPIVDARATGLNPIDKGGDSRNNSLDGLSLRLSFQKSFSEKWSWQAGLMVGGTRFKHEYVGDIRSTDWTHTANDTTTWADFYVGNPVEGGLKVSPYVGLSWKVSEISSIELNLLGLNYTALDYRHQAGMGTYVEDPNGSTGRYTGVNAFPADKLEKTSRLVPQVEFAYVFHF